MLFDGVLGGDDKELGAQRIGGAVDGHLAFVHRLKKRRLRLGRGAVDLVGQQDVGEDRALGQAELARLEIVEVHAQHVPRHQVGGELHATEIERYNPGQAACQQGLGGARRAFQQAVTAGENRGQQHVDQGFLPLHDLADLGADGVSGFLKFGEIHECSLLSQEGFCNG